MSDRFRNKYRIESARLKHWDYGWNAFYFVTICTKNRVCFFGDVVKGKMVLNEIGQIATVEWLRTFDMRPDMNLSMGEFVVMPNHFHAIIGIGKNEYNAQCDVQHGTQRDTQSDPQRGTQRGPQRRDAMHCVSTPDTPDTNGNTENKFGPQSKNLASIIRGFKIGVTKNARLINPEFAWQPLYHDHIIRNEESFYRISEYITNNPLNWNKDTFFK